MRPWQHGGAVINVDNLATCPKCDAAFTLAQLGEAPPPATDSSQLSTNKTVYH